MNDAHYYLANGLMDTGNAQQAIQEFDRAIAADPANNRAMSSYYKLALLYRRLNNTQAEQAAMQNFLRMKNQAAAEKENYTAQVVRDRATLPVADPERAAMTTGP